MVGMANASMGVQAIRQQIASAIDLFVHIARLGDGSRRVTAITECVGIESGQVTLQDIFVFSKTGITEQGRVTGAFRATGIRPAFSDRLRYTGFQLPASVFQTVVEIGGSQPS
jgi:pilus assembly protein CpaF